MKSAKDIDNELKRINGQIQQAAKVFGTESRLYKHYETILEAASEAGLTRVNKAGQTVLSRSKAAISEYGKITAYQKMLTRLSATQTVQKQKQMIYMRYEERTGIKPKSREMKEQVLSEYQTYNEVEMDLFDKLQEVYKLEKQEGGITFKGTAEIKKLSKGHDTKTADLQKMLKIANSIVDGENREILENAGFHRW